MVAVDGLFGAKLRIDLGKRYDDVIHHHSSTRERVILRPRQRLPIILEKSASIWNVRKVRVGKVDEPAPHIFLRLLDEVSSDPVAGTTGAGVQHNPDVLVLVKANFDEVIPGTEGPKMVADRMMLNLRMLSKDGVIATCQHHKRQRVLNRDVMPRSTVAYTSIVGATMWNTLLDQQSNNS